MLVGHVSKDILYGELSSNTIPIKEFKFVYLGEHQFNSISIVLECLQLCQILPRLPTNMKKEQITLC